MKIIFISSLLISLIISPLLSQEPTLHMINIDGTINPSISRILETKVIESRIYTKLGLRDILKRLEFNNNEIFKKSKAQSYNSNKTHIEYKIVFSTAMKKALTDFNPDFKVYEQKDYNSKLIAYYDFLPNSIPSAVIGDFNGDNRPDAYLKGHDKDSSISIVLFSNSTGTYNVFLRGKALLNTRKDYPWAFKNGKYQSAYYFQPKGSSYDCGGDMAIVIHTLKNDAIAEVEFYSKSPQMLKKVIYYWNTEKKEFEQCGLSYPFLR